MNFRFDGKTAWGLLVVAAALLFSPSPQNLRAQDDPRDPDRLSVAALEAAIADHDTETSALLAEISVVWDEMRAQLEESTPARQRRRVLRRFDSERKSSEKEHQRYLDLVRDMLVRQLAVAEANDGNAFGVAVPFFMELDVVEDGRTDTTMPLGGSGEVVFTKAAPQPPSRRRGRSRRAASIGELDLALQIEGPEPADIKGVSVSLLAADGSGEFVASRVKVFEFVEPHLEPAEPVEPAEPEEAEPALSHAGALKLKVEAPSPEITADVLESMIISGQVILQVEVSLSPLEGGFILETGSELFDLAGAPDSLKTVAPPTPEDLASYVADEAAAIVLGKALFWDVQVSSPNTVACATCHARAGADIRVTHQFSPAPNLGTFPGNNLTATWADFPLQDGLVFGSQGIAAGDFLMIDVDGNEVGVPGFDDVFEDNALVTNRNAPSVINAAYNSRQYWDGRAVREFNGVNNWGSRDPNAVVYQSDVDGVVSSVHVAIKPASLASQAVAPVLSHVEMSWVGRTWGDVGRKLLDAQPLALQEVHVEDSVLGPYAVEGGNGLNISYAELIEAAFQPEWWDGFDDVVLENGESYEHMEANMSLFFGLAVMLYEQTLISNDSKYDQWKEGTAELTFQEQHGLELFLNAGKCINCHEGPEFSSASHRVTSKSPIELMPMKHFRAAYYDDGFYNIGVTQTAEDLGVGAEGPFGPLSFTRQERNNPGSVSGAIRVTGAFPDAVDGSFKANTVRNTELNGPYMHNGKHATLEQVVQFYARGGDWDNDELSPDITVLESILNSPTNQAALVAFIKTLTDERVRWERAPFDHPSLVIPNYEPALPAVGASGADVPIESFEDELNEQDE